MMQSDSSAAAGVRNGARANTMDISGIPPHPDGARSLRLSPGERRLAALGVEPILVGEPVAAAACGLPVRRFRAECPLPGLRMGRSRLWPLDELRRWARRHWAAETGYDGVQMGSAAPDEDWASRLPGAAKPEGGRRAASR